jgi:hypothetical protein
MTVFESFFDHFFQASNFEAAWAVAKIDLKIELS